MSDSDVTLSKEKAEAEIQRIADMVDSDLEEKDFEDKDIKRIMRGIMRGSVTVNEVGEPTVHFSEPVNGKVEFTTFFQPKGGVILALDEGKKDKDIAKTFGLMAKVTRTSDKLFENMQLADLKMCQSIMGLFLA